MHKIRYKSLLAGGYQPPGTCAGLPTGAYFGCYHDHKWGGGPMPLPFKVGKRVGQEIVFFEIGGS